MGDDIDNQQEIEERVRKTSNRICITSGCNNYLPAGAGIFDVCSECKEKERAKEARKKRSHRKELSEE